MHNARYDLAAERFDLEKIIKEFVQANEVHQKTFVGQPGFLTKWYGTNVVYPMSLALPDFPTFQAQEGDTVICGVAKSGASRVCANVGSVLHADDPQWLYQAPDLQQKIPWLDFCTAVNKKGPRGLEQVNAMSAPRAYWTRVSYEGLPPTCRTKAKIVYHLRHPKDTVVTLYHHYKAREKFTRFAGTVSDLVETLVTDEITSGPWFMHMLSYWRNRDNNMLMVSFEDFSQDTTGSIRKLAQFLEVHLTDSQVERIAFDCHFDQMRKNEHCNHCKNAAAGEIKIFNNVLPIMRSGKVGGWREHLSQEDNQKINQWMLRNLENPEVAELAKAFPATFAVDEL